MKQLTDAKTCPVCNGNTLTLCEDFTRYSRVVVQDGELVAQYDHDEMEDSGFDPLGPRRLFCCDCGEYLDISEEAI